jgi:hypothetical protein
MIGRPGKGTTCDYGSKSCVKKYEEELVGSLNYILDKPFISP